MKTEQQTAINSFHEKYTKFRETLYNLVEDFKKENLTDPDALIIGVDKNGNLMFHLDISCIKCESETI